ncbi:MAG: tetratricopeptide repeat protein [Lachnospiraceae bacterium]|jgi:Flp pilus assembly protein TadD
MKCYRCNARLLDDRNVCPRCGADIRLYRKIIYTSNEYYNLGLDRAKARDITGAEECLKTSLQLWKKNINARNLLGLCYYETGEAALALKEWVISKNFRHRGNPADGYIREMRENRGALDSADVSIHKYNQALEYARSGSYDLAVIQLKKVISTTPGMLKAHLLLALLLMNDQKYEEADRVISHCLKQDRGNPQAIAFKKEIAQYLPARKKQPIGVAGELEREEVIIPVRMRDYGSYFMNALLILAGFVLALGVLYFIIMPGRESQYQAQNDEQIAQYEEKYNSLNAQISDLNTQIEELTSELDSANSQLDSQETDTAGLKSAYESIMSVADLYIQNDFMTFAEEFPNLDPDASDEDAYQQMYSLMQSDFENNLTNRLFAMAESARETEGNRETAIQICDKILELDSTYDSALFYKALCTEELGNQDEAIVLYIQYLQQFPSGQWVTEIRNRLTAISPQTLQQYDAGAFNTVDPSSLLQSTTTTAAAAETTAAGETAAGETAAAQ